MKFSIFLFQRFALMTLSMSTFAGAIFYSTSAFTAELTMDDYHYLPANEIKQLQVNGQEIPALLRPWLGKAKHGLAIIVPDFSQRADAPGAANYLRHQLNYSGWATLALTPASLSQPAYFATKADEITKAGEQEHTLLADQETPDYSDEELAKIQQQQHDFMLNSMMQLDSLGKDYSGKRMIIAFGESANLVAGLLKENRLPSPNVFVVINPYSDIDTINKQLAKKLTSLTMPVLDLQSSDGSSESLATQPQRLSLAPENAPNRYSQQILALDLSQPMSWDNTLYLIKGFAARINKAYPNG